MINQDYFKEVYMFHFSTLVLVIGLLSTPCFAGLTENKQLVTDFYELAFNQYQPVQAAEKYLSEGYIQHNPHVASGRAAFIEAFKDEFKTVEAKKSKNVFKRTIAEDDLVVLHSHKTRFPGDIGVAGIDIFRVKDGKITEHWDVNQKIPEKSKNSNTMF
jgi:predicted SnoaL-like aldol condensation-catalyzing enzyme